jgi:hypothetical protein
MTPAGGRLALAGRAADGSAQAFRSCPSTLSSFTLVKSIVSCLGTAPGLPVSHFQHRATRLLAHERWGATYEGAEPRPHMAGRG